MRRQPSIHTAEIALRDARTRLEWVVDSDFRFFPTLSDNTFGFVLHPVDLAINKVMAAAGRRAVRDLVDLVTIHDAILPVGAVVWAAVEKSPGFTPEGLIGEIRRNARYPAAEWRSLETSAPLNPAAILERLRSILDEAEAFVTAMPSAKAGLLFLENGTVVQPVRERLDTYQTHSAQRSGHWPSSEEIAAAMLERLRTSEEKNPSGAA